MRYFLQLSYFGKAYHGWQIQPNAPTVQQTLQKALATLLRRTVEVVGAGRTDTGVHARFYIAHFDLEEEITHSAQFCYHLNGLLPFDIAVHGVCKVQQGAHARFDAQQREYQYQISLKKDPFTRDTAWYCHFPLELQAMNRAAAHLVTVKNFASFEKLHSDNKTSICHLQTALWEERDELLVFTISADRFLRNMVRAIVGTLVEVGRGKLSYSEFEQVCQGQQRSLAATSAPPQGLFLTRVDYPASIYCLPNM